LNWQKYQSWMDSASLTALTQSEYAQSLAKLDLIWTTSWPSFETYSRTWTVLDLSRQP